MDDSSNILTSLRKYVLVGVIATGVDWAVFSILVFGLDWHYLLGGTVSFIVATLAGYLSGLRLVFRSGRHERWVEVAFVYATSTVGLVIHLGMLIVFFDWLELHLFVSKAMATAVTFLWNFAARYYWIFEKDVSNA